MRRVFAIDVLECPACGGRMHVIAVIEDPRVIRAILDCLGVPAHAPTPCPPRHPARIEPASQKARYRNSKRPLVRLIRRAH